MPLPTFDSLDAVPESLREFAREADGKVTLDLVPGAEVVGLKSNAAKLLAEKKALQEQYRDVDVEEYRTLKDGKGKGADLAARLDAAAREKADLEAKLAAIATARRSDVKRAEIAKAIAAADAEIELLEPIVERFVDVEEVDGRPVVVVRDAQGAPRYKDGQGTRFELADLLGELAANPKFARAFNSTVGSGGGARSSSSAGVKTVNVHNPKEFGASLDDIAAGKVKLVG
jgi:hypothetical protein